VWDSLAGPLALRGAELVWGLCGTPVLGGAQGLPENKEPLDWNMRMKVAGAAKGLEYLHDKANPP